MIENLAMTNKLMRLTENLITFESQLGLLLLKDQFLILEMDLTSKVSFFLQILF